MIYNLEIYQEFIKKWGSDPQLEKLEEELIELLHEIKKYRKNKHTSMEPMLDELVDVEICLEQARIIMNIDETSFINHKEYKLNRGLKLCGLQGVFKIDCTMKRYIEQQEALEAEHEALKKDVARYFQLISYGIDNEFGIDDDLILDEISKEDETIYETHVRLYDEFEVLREKLKKVGKE